MFLFNNFHVKNDNFSLLPLLLRITNLQLNISKKYLSQIFSTLYSNPLKKIAEQHND